MELQRAIEQLANIHDQLTRTEYYRGFRAIPVALTGLLALLAAFIQSQWLPEPTAKYFVLFWLGIALINSLLSGILLICSYVFYDTDLERRKAHSVLMQFGPCLLTGALITATFYHTANDATLFYLPGIWHLVFSMGVFACRPYLPGRTFWVGVYYMLAGAVLLMLSVDGHSLNHWGMGLGFGIGQLLAAGVIYWDMERWEREKS